MMAYPNAVLEAAREHAAHHFREVFVHDTVGRLASLLVNRNSTIGIENAERFTISSPFEKGLVAIPT